MKCPACGEDELEYGICFYCKHEVTDAERLDYLRENPEMDFDNELPALERAAQQK